MLLYFRSLLTVSFNLILELFLSPHLATAVHPVIDCVINLISLSIISFVGCRGKQASTVTCKLEDGDQGGGANKMGGGGGNKGEGHIRWEDRGRGGEKALRWWFSKENQKAAQSSIYMHAVLSEELVQSSV